jgi:hypothetical protein
MLIYRFRITSEEFDDFLRVIEIQPGQTFLDFHECLLTNADIDKCDRSFFYITDNSFKKQREISLKPLKKQVKKYDDDLDEIVTETFEPFLMKDVRIKDFVEDPHQRMIYEFFGKDFLVFFVELFKIIKTDEKILLPRCIQSKGEIPKKLDASSLPVTAPPEEAAPIHPPLMNTAGVSLFSAITEDETEIAEIENHLGEILAAADSEEIEEKPETSRDDVTAYSVHQDADEDDKDSEQMESLDEYDDIENLEIKQRDFDRDSDDY